MLIVVSLSWAVIVDSIPENERPYIGSSQTNSVIELAFGYNGIARLTGNHNRQFTGKEVALNRTNLGGGTIPKGISSGGNMFGTGEKGVLRLFQAGLSGQASWLIPFAAWACLTLFRGIRKNNITSRHKESLFGSLVIARHGVL